MACPDITFAQSPIAAPAVCNADGTARTVTFYVNNTSGTAVDVDYDYGDGSSGRVSVPAGGAILTHDFATAATTITYTATFTKADGSCSDTESVVIEPCCRSEIEIDARAEECSELEPGKREVVFSIDNDGEDAEIELSYGDGETEPRTVIGSTPISFTHNYDVPTARTYIATLVITGCPSITIETPLLEPCAGGDDDCPDVAFTVDEKDCDEDGNREVTVTAVIVAADGRTFIRATLDVEGNSDEKAGEGIVMIPVTGSYAGTSVVATLTFGEPAGCPPVTKTIAVTPCEEPKCPDPEIHFEWGDCTDGQRDLTLTASVTATNATQPVAGQLIVNGVLTDAQSGTGNINLSAPTQTVAIGSMVTATVTINEPPDCGIKIVSQRADACDDSSGGSASCWCSMLFWFAVSAFVASLILTIIGACTLNPFIGLAAAASLLTAVLALLLWALLCASADRCAILAWLRFILTNLIVVIAIMALLGDPCALAGALDVGLFLTVVSYLEYLIHCVPWPWEKPTMSAATRTRRPQLQQPSSPLKHTMRSGVVAFLSELVGAPHRRVNRPGRRCNCSNSR